MGIELKKMSMDKMKQYLDAGHNITMKWYLMIGGLGGGVATFVKSHGEEIVLTGTLGFTGAFAMGMGKLVIDLMSRMLQKKKEEEK